MAFLAPDPTGVAGPVLSATHLGPPDTGLNPISQNKPAAVKALTRKYGDNNLAAIRDKFGKQVADDFVKWEMQRAQRGISPASNEQTIKMLQAAKSRKAATEAPDRNPLDFLGNAASDVGDIVTSIPKMPQQIVHDVVHLPDTFKALQSGDINQILEAPGIRLLPGAYTVDQLTQGHFGELASHPVATALDVLPYAEKGLKIPVGDTTLGGKIAESPVGELAGRVKGTVRRSMPGQLARQSWGHDTRDVARILAEESNIMHQSAIPAMGAIYKDGLDRLLQAGTVASQHINDVIPDVQRQGVIKGAMEDPASVGARDMQGALDAVGATDAERGAALAFKSHADALRQYGLDAGMIHERTVLGNNEVYTTKAAQKIDAGRAKVSRYETLAATREAILDPKTADLGALEQKVGATLNDPNMKLRDKRAVAAGYVHALDAAGYDTGTMLSDIGRANKSTLSQAIYDEHGNLRATPASGEVRTRRRTGQPALDSRTRWLEQHKGYSSKGLAKLQEKTGLKESRVLPARWQPAFQRIKIDKAAGYIEQHFNPDDPQVPAMLEAVHNHVYADLGKEAIDTINKEAMETVNELRKAGYDPEFVHHVSPDQERAMASLSTTTLVPKVSQYGVRINDWTPSSDSLSVSLSHQGMELARQRASRYGLDRIRDSHTVSVQQATAELRPIAERAAARSGRTYGAELERLMRKEYVRWSETENGFMAGNAKQFKFSQGNFGPDELLIPRHLANSLKMLAEPPTYSRIFDPVLKVFRTSVLPFSPRFHLNNIVGGMISGVIEDPRILAKVPQGMKLAKEFSDMNRALIEGKDFELSAAAQHFLETAPREFVAQMGGLKYSVAPENLWKMKAGGKLGELAQAAGMDRIAKAGGRAIDWSYNFNELVDTGYRMAGYLSEEANALKKGLSPEDAAARGMALANSFMPRWLEMTPMERSVFRVMFPFYGYMSHVFRFAARFPMDHPWRASVMSAVSRAELEDWGTGLPQALQSAFFLGDPFGTSAPKGGSMTAITPGAANPFRDLGDNMTLAGFLGQTNPIFKGVLQQLGYDPVSRGPNLYPEVEYDPETGRFKATPTDTPGLLGSTVTGFIPQANILAALTGTSGDFRNLIESNPDAATRMLSSSAGIPILWKKYNLNEQAFTAEMNRQTSAKDVLSAAMRTGDYRQAMRYPSLRSTVVALQKLKAAGKLTPYEVGTTPSIAANNARQQGSQAVTQAEVRNG